MTKMDQKMKKKHFSLKVDDSQIGNLKQINYPSSGNGISALNYVANVYWIQRNRKKRTS